MLHVDSIGSLSYILLDITNQAHDPELTCTITTPNPISSANGLLNTLTPNPPNTPNILPRLIFRTARGFNPPDCLTIGVSVLVERVVRPLKSDVIFVKGSGPSQSIGRLYCRMRRGVLRMSGAETMRPRRKPGNRKDMSDRRMWSEL